MTAFVIHLNTSHENTCSECSHFLNWSGEVPETPHGQAVLFRSLVATVNLHPALDASLEAKTVKLLEYLSRQNQSTADAFLDSLGQTTHESLMNFIQSIVVLISSPSQDIAAASVEMFHSLIKECSLRVNLALVKADMIPQLVRTLNPQSLSFAIAEDIHINLLKTIRESIWLATPNGLTNLKIEDDNKQQAVHETVLKQVLTPSEQYICHLCMNRYSIIDGEQSAEFINFLAQLLRIPPYYPPTMDFVLNMPVVLTITSCLTYIEDDESIWNFLYHMNGIQWERNEKGGQVRQLGKIVNRMMRLEGIEDVMEEKLQNNRKQESGFHIVLISMEWSNLQGLNLPPLS
ncbi:hypothetical protein BLNAU_16433 [Blattamonas nauphoetae]|uniref:Uncharacterized protein n=1 Tax=Blattamonas nauphoetae TaxID=2049346 RepID=A0ABQ9XB57_9EUKA|nr:hypothetical protein BLNAU_16433 [Blattamonas nauphoetae]